MEQTTQTTEATFTDKVTAELVQANASDISVAAAARVSTLGASSNWETEEQTGLINFLMRNRHGTPFEHNQFIFRVHAPIFVYREFHRHRIGWCLAGDTEVWCETLSPNSGRTLRKRSIESLYHNWHKGVTDRDGRTRMLPSCRNFTVRTLDEQTGQFILSTVNDIYANGDKPVVKVETDHGESIRCTTDHAVWTPEGWAKVGDLEVDDLIGRNGKVALNPGGQVPPALRNGIGVWTSMQRQAMIKPVDTCYLCEGVFDFDALELDHVVPVVDDLTSALDTTNLAPVCKPCHRIKTNGEQARAVRGQTAGVRWTRITGVTPDGVVPTFDLELEGPNRGFVANGLVVHNSYNEESGRYTELEPVFYVPNEERNLVQIGKVGDYEFIPGDRDQHDHVVAAIKASCKMAYRSYRELLDEGIAKEVARMMLPVNIYSTMYATCNARSLMAFLSLRTNRPDAAFPSKPMREIEMVAEQIEGAFQDHMPLTHAAFDASGRVCP